MEFSNQPWNNGYISVGIARMFRDQPWTWNPLQYGGAPFRYLYPPLFHVLVGLIPFVSLARAFHLMSGIAHALVPVCLYVLARQLFAARLPAVFAALAYSVFPSPAYVLAAWRAIAQPFAHAPWGFVAMTAFDEAPHAFGFSFALLALAAAWRERWTLAALLAGAVLLINWPALIGLGFPLAGLAVARAKRSGVVDSIAAVAGLAGTAYGIAAFWMTPGYFVSSTLLNRIVLRHTLFAEPWSGASWVILAAALAVAGPSLWRRVPPEFALILVWAAVSGLVIVSYTLARNYLVPSPQRYMLEFNTALILLVAALLSLLRGRMCLVVCPLLIAGCFVLSFRFVTHAWKLEPQSSDPHQGPAYSAAMWLKDHAGSSRVLASGELDSTLNLWTDVAQVGGTGQDVSNFLIFAAERQVAFGCGSDSGDIAELWLRALNAPLAVVHKAASREYFHWYAQPEKFSALPVAWDDGAGDVVYRVPNFDAQEAVVVDLASLAVLPRMESTADRKFLNAYVKWAAGKRPVAVRWSSPADASFDVDLAPGEAVLLKINNDPGWHTSGATIANDPIGFQLIRAEPGQRHIVLRFGASWDTWLGRAITVAAFLLLLARVRGIYIAAVAVIPAVVAWGILLSQTPLTARIAEDAFIRLQPPLINPGGIVNVGREVSLYGLNFGGPHDEVKVWVGDRPVSIAFRGPNQINFHLPDQAPPAAPVTVEVNGCRGNSFAIANPKP